MKFYNNCLLSVLLALILGGANTARATLMAYEGFNYTAGDSLTNASAQGSGGSFGWGGRWAASSTAVATNVAGSLFYTDTVGNVLVTNGGSVVVGVLAGATANSQPSRSFNFGTLNGTTYTGLTNSPGTYWASFIMQWIGPVTAGSPTNQYGRKGDLAFRVAINTNAPSGGTALYSVGSPNVGNRIGTPYDTWTTWTGSDAGAGTQNTGLAASSAPLNATTFVLMRINLDGGGGNDTVYTWFNWTNLNAEPDISTANTTNNTANEDGLNNIHLDANGGNGIGTNTVLAMDEFRFGNTFADVTPHSSGSVLPPVITLQPASVAVTVTYPAAFSVSVLGAAPIYYQWYFNTNTLRSGDTNATMTINSVAPGDAGTYSCIVSNVGGAVTSSVATLTILAPVAPGISSQPQNWTNAIGFPATFSVGATGSAPLGYQWYFNTGTALVNQTNSILSFIIANTNNAGGYSVVVTNRFGSITSDVVNLTVSAFGASQLPAFPGADGPAKLVSGGRGGTVYHVTRLDQNFNDSTPGTLYYGLSSVQGPKTIVFDVAGVFWLGLSNNSVYDNAWDVRSRINVSANTTVAGQTAPGPVIIMGGTVHCDAGNIIFRNVTIAPGYGMRTFNEPGVHGPVVGDFPDTYAFDAMDIQGPNTMIDHVTTLYTTDESISCNELAYNLTVQNCNVSQGQNFPQLDAESSTTSYEGHAFAHLLQAGSNGKVSMLNNLYAHMKSRLPRVGSEVGTGALNDFRNNVYYNWLNPAGYSVVGQPSLNNFINNFYLAGPGGEDAAGGANSNIVFRAGGTVIFSGADSSKTHIYQSGNLKDINKNGSPNDTVDITNSDFGISDLQPVAYDVNIGLTLGARDAFTNVLRYVGSRWWERPYDFTLNNPETISTNDMNAYVNERLINETVTGTGKIMAWADDPFNNDPSEGWEWRALLALRADPVTGAAPYNRPADWDTDGDGMPDWWEIEHGLDPNVPNSNGDFDNDGYTDLEEYLNEVAAWPAPAPVFFTGEENNRFAIIFNWRVYGQQVNITNLGNVTTFSFWQPSRYDTAVISNATVVVDAVGQHAGVLQLTNNAKLNITNGWLNVATRFENGTGCTSTVSTAGSLITSNLVNKGTLRLTGAAGLTVSGTFTNTGTLDVMTWNGTLPAGLVNTGVILDRSLLKISSAAPSGTNCVVTMQGYSGHVYQLQYRDSLESGSWQNLGPAVDGTNAPVDFSQPRGTGIGQRFYRIAVGP